MLFLTNLVILALAQEREVSCPDSFTLQGKKCVSDITAAPVITCEEGNPRGGVCFSSTDPKYECDGGSILEDGVCVKRSETSMILKVPPEGYYDNGTAYVRDIILEQKLMCSAGIMQGDVCVVINPVPRVPKRYCPEGSILDSKGCATRLDLELQPICDYGNFFEGSCVTYAEMTPTESLPICPEDHLLHGDKCVKEVVGKAIDQCPDGSESDSYGKCKILKTVPVVPKPSCPIGYELFNGDQCRQEVIGMKTARCPSGALPSDEGCVHISRTEPLVEYFCPEGYTEVAGKDQCYKLDRYNCSPPLLDGKAQSMPAGLRHGGSNVVTRTIEKQCERKQFQDKLEKKQCPDGYEISALGGCIAYTPVDKVMSCNLPGVTNEDCKGWAKSPIVPVIDCPDPYKLVDDVCSAYFDMDPIKICESSGNLFTEQTCRIAVETSQMTSKTCDPGFSLSEGEDRCVKLTKVPPRMVCENQHLGVDECHVTKYIKPFERSSCPAGAIEKGDKCLVKITLEPELLCENGNSLENCTETDVLQYEYQCPHWAKKIGNKCFEESTFELSATCTEGDYRGGMCIKTVPSNATCPAGMRLDGDVCYGKTFAEPIVTYTRTCTGKNCDAETTTTTTSSSTLTIIIETSTSYPSIEPPAQNPNWYNYSPVEHPYLDNMVQYDNFYDTNAFLSFAEPIEFDFNDLSTYMDPYDHTNEKGTSDNDPIYDNKIDDNSMFDDMINVDQPGEESYISPYEEPEMLDVVIDEAFDGFQTTSGTHFVAYNNYF